MSGRSDKRPMIKDYQIERANCDIMVELWKILEVKGHGSFASRHELNGILDEEHNVELKKASHESKKDFIEYRKELMQIAVTAIFGVACIDAGTLEW
jgi:hypothetical protein